MPQYSIADTAGKIENTIVLKKKKCSGQNKKNDIKNNCNIFFLSPVSIFFFSVWLSSFLFICIVCIPTVPIVEFNSLILLLNKQFDMVASCCLYRCEKCRCYKLDIVLTRTSDREIEKTSKWRWKIENRMKYERDRKKK